MRTAAFVSITSAIVLAFAAVTDSAKANASPINSHLVIAIDVIAATRTEDALNVAKTISLNAASTWDGGSISLLPFGIDLFEQTVVSTDSENRENIFERFFEDIDKTSTSKISNLFRPVATIFDYLSQVEALAGSSGLIITDNGLENHTDNEQRRLLEFAGLIQSEGWILDIAALPHASPKSRIYLKDLAEIAGGGSYDTGTTMGIFTFLNHSYKTQSVPSIQTALPKSATALATVEIAPMTDQLFITAVREKPDAHFEIFDTRGAPVNSLRSDTTSFETPNAIVIGITKPDAGTWTLQAIGDGSNLLVGVHVENPLELGLVDAPPTPVGQPTLISAAASIGDQVIPLEGSYMEMAIRNSDGESVVYRLEDDGIGLDKSPGDGIFSAVIHGLNSQNLNEVSLTLQWDSLRASIKGQDVLASEHFPILKVLLTDPDPIVHGTEINVGVVEIRVGEYPFPVAPSGITVKLLSEDSFEFEAKIVPKNETSNGKAWQYDIWSVPTISARYLIKAQLVGKYLEREYTVLNQESQFEVSVLPEPPIRIVVVRPGLTTLPVWVLILISLGILSLTAGFIFAIARHRVIEPYGYLYDDQGNIIVDFSSKISASLSRLFTRNRVPLNQLPGMTDIKGELRFMSIELEFHSTSGKGLNIRINGRPTGKVEHIHDGARLGIGGRLYTFVRERQD